MKEVPLRKSQRFIVSPHFPITIQISKSASKAFRLRSIGLGGMGFYGSTRDAHLLREGEMTIELVAGKQKIPFKARVQYSRFLPKTEGGVNYIGVKFEDLDQRTDVILKTLLQGGLSRGHLIIT